MVFRGRESSSTSSCGSSSKCSASNRFAGLIDAPRDWNSRGWIVRAALGISRTFFHNFFPSGNGLTAYVQLNITRCRGIFCSRGRRPRYPAVEFSRGQQPRLQRRANDSSANCGLPNELSMAHFSERKPRRGGRVVDGSGLENRQGASPRGFESHPLRQLNGGFAISDCGLKASEQRATHRSHPESRQR
jgi:hypothetical protein